MNFAVLLLFEAGVSFESEEIESKTYDASDRWRKD